MGGPEASATVTGIWLFPSVGFVKVGAFDHQPTPMCNHCARVA